MQVAVSSRALKRAVIALGVALMAALGSCGFPEAAFAPDGEMEGGRADGEAKDSRSEGAEDGSADDDSGEITIDGASPDALIVVDAGQKIDATACQPADCDCDKDGFKNVLKAGCAGGPADCDDFDSRAHPGQGYLEARAEPPMFGDWDCVNGAEALYKGAVTCAGLTLGLGCPDIYGFEDQPSCGETGSWIRCKKQSGLGLSCVVALRETRKQPCK